MGLFAKFLIAAMVISALLPFTILKGKDGKPLMSFSDIKGPEMPKLPDSIPGASSLPDSGNKDVIYKWKDKEGLTQFTSTPPPPGVEYTSKGYDPDMNLIQSVEVKKDEPVAASDSQKKISKPSDIGNPYSPEKIEKLFDDANNLEKLLNDRMKKQEAALGQ